MQSQFLDYGYYLVFISLLCLLPFFRRGLFVFFLFCFFSFNAHAGFFLNDNQEGLRFFKNQQYDLALKKFKDPFWKSIIFYKQNKNEEALKELLPLTDDLSFYNKGVILTRLCKYKEALDAFETAYRLNPKNEDALYNKQILDKLFDDAKKDPSLLECQNNQQNQQNQSNDQNKNSSQDEKNSDSESNNSSNSNSEQNQNSNPQDQENQEQTQSANPQEDENQEQDSSESQGNPQNSSEQEQNNNDKSQQNTKPQSTDSSNKQENNTDNQQKDSSSSTQESSLKDKTGDSGEQTSSQQKVSQTKDSPDDVEDEASGTSIKNKKDTPQGDEEVLAKQRQYREIPENIGGLLREFIKKEYLKDRYHDESK